MSTARTYGGWRRSRGIGLLGLDAGQTILLVVVLLALVIVASFSVKAFVVLCVPGAAVVIGALARWDGIPLSRAVAQRLRWAWGVRRGWTTSQTGIWAAHEGAWELPGILAPTDLISVTDAVGDFGLVWHKRLGTLTITLRCAAASTWLVDPEQVDAWVANWDSWLANLGYVPMIRWVAVTVDTCPRGAESLAAGLRQRIRPGAPAAAQRIMTQLVATASTQTSHVETLVSITFDPAMSPARPGSLDEAVDEVRQALPGIEQALAGCGAVVRGRASADYLTGVVRGAFDPERRTAALAAGGEDAADWSTAGPVGAREHVGHYEHDSGVSVSWSWHEAPRQRVTANVLARLLAPCRFPKRVTLLYRPYTASEAATVVESEVNAAQFRTDLRRARKLDPNARERADQERAHGQAAEEATGAGMCRVGLWATATVASVEELPRAIAEVEQRAETSKIRLRRLWRSQAAGFAATLPAGICPPQLAAQWPR